MLVCINRSIDLSANAIHVPFDCDCSRINRSIDLSANAIKIQIWVTLIANLLLMVIQKRIKRKWSLSGMATIVRISPNKSFK